MHTVQGHLTHIHTPLTSGDIFRGLHESLVVPAATQEEENLRVNQT